MEERPAGTSQEPVPTQGPAWGVDLRWVGVSFAQSRGRIFDVLIENRTPKRVAQGMLDVVQKSPTKRQYGRLTARGSSSNTAGMGSAAVRNVG